MISFLDQRSIEERSFSSLDIGWSESRSHRKRAQVCLELWIIYNLEHLEVFCFWFFSIYFIYQKHSSYPGLLLAGQKLSKWIHTKASVTPLSSLNLDLLQCWWKVSCLSFSLIIFSSDSHSLKSIQFHFEIRSKLILLSFSN